MITVLIVDDHTLVRQGIRSLLELDPDIEVTGEADDGAAAVASIELDPPDVVLLDLRMPRFDGLWTLRALQDRGITVPVLVLTTFDDDELVLGALRAGAKGYLLKDVTFERLGGAVRELAAGRTLAQPAITERLLDAFRTGKHGPSDVGVADTLTAREIDVLRLWPREPSRTTCLRPFSNWVRTTERAQFCVRCATGCSTDRCPGLRPGDGRCVGGS